MPEISVSDHALVRWLERQGIVNVELERNVIRGLLADVPLSGEFTLIRDGMKFVVKDGVLVTFFSR